MTATLTPSTQPIPAPFCAHPDAAAQAVGATKRCGKGDTAVTARIPARRAVKIATVAAMRDVAVDDSGRSKVRTVIGLAVTGLGAVAMAAGLFGATVLPPSASAPSWGSWAWPASALSWFAC
jgi:hypothetical protein